MGARTTTSASKCFISSKNSHAAVGEKGLAVGPLRLVQSRARPGRARRLINRHDDHHLHSTNLGVAHATTCIFLIRSHLSSLTTVNPISIYPILAAVLHLGASSRSIAYPSGETTISSCFHKLDLIGSITGCGLWV